MGRLLDITKKSLPRDVRRKKLGRFLTIFSLVVIVSSLLFYFLGISILPWSLGLFLLASPVWAPLAACGVYGVLLAFTKLRTLKETAIDYGSVTEIVHITDFRSVLEFDRRHCPLCLKKLTPTEWGSDGMNHRLTCMKSSEYGPEYEQLPILFDDISCPKCSQRNLKLWPRHHTRGFRCNLLSDQCEGRDLVPHVSHTSDSCMGIEAASELAVIVNKGYNMLKCFPCDYTMCLNCAKGLHHSQSHVRPVRSAPQIALLAFTVQKGRSAAPALPDPVRNRMGTLTRSRFPSYYEAMMELWATQITQQYDARHVKDEMRLTPVAAVRIESEA